ncbi:glycerophosphodiester phosphodiesterase [Hymenobacter latericus]|uniref:glycerophosphodiester phosphodiesterase n=1 Tax=Hymenobacter sp. YIM 151858-1 TaxID=2987688 RepID=UPI0022265CC5|nr:glycerophosphodiester phosphodiesterase [Hymenobacter sp. YIM 151858-1]UYZ57408.1 glycerophosphodiester phosphodiesterase [Hymenobacter sp. YIM 151858-1]
MLKSYAAVVTARRAAWLICVFGVGLVACSRHAGSATSSANRAPVQVIGHAGSGFFTPINPFNPLPPSSLAGVAEALGAGADGVEVDVQLSRDSIPVLYHDAELQSMTTGQGCVSQHPAAALQQLRYRGGPPYDWFQQERVATLEQLLQELSKRPTFPYLHLDLHENDACQPRQPYARSPQLVRALGRLLRQYQVPAERVLIVTEHVPSLRQFKTQLPDVALGLEITDAFNERLPVAAVEGVQAVVLPKRLATPEHMAQARSAGLQVVLFGGRSGKSIRRLLALQPDAIEVDNVPQMLKQLGRNRAMRSNTANAPNLTSVR